MAGRKRTRPEVGSIDELEDWARKCFYCQHCYVRANNADEWLCSKRSPCKFKPFKEESIANNDKKMTEPIRQHLNSVLK